MKAGIVGLPNVGKSTLFNCLSNAKAQSANFPFCTIEPNIGVVNVPDPRLKRLESLVQPEKVVPATVEIVDIADLPEKYQYGDVQAYEPDYPEEILEREAFNALFAEAAAQEPEEDHNEQSHEGLNGMVSSSLPEEGVNLKEYLSELEVNLIRQALDNQDWVVARAADKLGMRRTTLVEKMRKYDIQRTEEA